MLFRNIKHHLPILKQIYLGINNGTETGVIDIFQDAPQLEQVFLYGPTTADISLPWPQIKTFINRDPLVCNGKPNYPVMSESSIVDLRVLRVTHQDLLAFWPERTLRYLETLHLDFMSRVGGTPGTDHDNFLGSLTLPKVSTISVTNYPGKLLPALFALMSRSFSGTSYMLTTLKLCHSLTFIELLSLSRVATSLETLVTCLPLSADSEGLLQLAFCPESHYSLRLPNLQKLHFFVTEEYHILTVSQIKGLTQIAETRCEIVETRNRQHPPLWKVRRLKDFRVVFPSAWECIVGQEALEAKRQYSLSPKSIQRIEFIADWLGPTDLNMVIKLFKHSHGSPLTHKNARKKRWFARFRGVEDDMCDIFNVAELYESGIHHFLYDLYHDNSRGRVSDDSRKEAKRILDKLGPMLLNDVRNRKWSYQGIHSICYISNDHWIWDLPEDEILTRMIYGHRFYANKYSTGMIIAPCICD